MLTIRRTIADKTIISESLEKGAWINLISPTEEEINKVAEQAGIFYDFLKYPLDDEERPRVEIEDDQILTIINIPVFDRQENIYDTIPLGIIITANHIVTVCLEDIKLLQDFYDGKVKGMATFKKTRFLFLILYKTATLYLKYLREINKKSEEIEWELHKSMKNKELIGLLNLEKSLVYFTTSLKSNQIVMEKLLKSNSLEKFSEDEDLLEDVIVENQQAIEMANIYTNILSGTMDAFASVISNNLNIVMKFLAAVTIILELPTMVASFFGMNVALPFQNSPFGFVYTLIISFIFSSFAALVLIKKKML